MARTGAGLVVWALGEVTPPPTLALKLLQGVALPGDRIADRLDYPQKCDLLCSSASLSLSVRTGNRYRASSLECMGS